MHTYFLKMMRRYSYRNYRGKSSKYSNETVSFNTQVTALADAGFTFPVGLDDQQQVIMRGIPVVPATNVLGNRKVKNFTIRLTANGNEDTIIGALVYIPEGTIGSPLLCTGPMQSLYEPNQNVICTFIIPPNVDRNADGDITQVSAPTQITVNSRLARNLNTGDYIGLMFCSPSGIDASAEYPCVMSPSAFLSTFGGIIKVHITF